MSRYHKPTCQAIELETGRVCGVRMEVLGERDPAGRDRMRPGHWVFRCPRCGAMRALAKEDLDRHAERI